MRKIFASSLFITLLFAASFAAEAQSAPRFENYRVPVYKGKRAPVNLRSAKGASSFRTRLREGAREGINFAGHFTLVGWGCGTGCGQAAVINAKTGAVYFPEQLGGYGVWLWDDNQDAVQYKPDSRLLILSGWPATESDNDNPKTGLYYYEWTGTRLKLVRFVARSREEGR